MLFALILVSFASLLFAITNYIDKYLISKVTNGGDYRGLVLVSSLIAGSILLPVSALITKFNINIDLVSFTYIFFSTSISIVALILYFKALNRDDTSLIVIMFQLIPVFGYFLGIIFLDEILTVRQIVGGLVVLLSAVFTAFEFTKMRFCKSKVITVFMMILSSLLYAIYYLFIRFATLNNSFDKVTFWYQVCLSLNGLIIFLLLKKYRESFVSLIESNGRKTFGLNVLNETLGLVATFLTNFAITLAPLAIVLTFNGLQPLFVFFVGVVLTLTMPRIIKEDITRKTMIQKTLCVIGCMIGLIVLYI